MPCYSHLNPRRRPLYRLRNDRSGREVLVPTEPGALYVNGETGDSLRTTGKLLPLAPSPSALPRSIENLRVCPSCEQLAQMDLNYCPYDRRRLELHAAECPDCSRGIRAVRALLRLMHATADRSGAAPASIFDRVRSDAARGETDQARET